MRVTLRVDGKTHTGKRPFTECEYIQFDGVDCPVCHTYIALVKDGRVMALCSPLSLADAVKEFPGCEEEKWEGPLKVRLPYYSIEGPKISGDAECTRCREKVGHMVVTTDSLFGVEEDMRVLNGRPRVY